MTDKTIEDDLFNDRISRIKSALGIKTDSELAKSLKISQQAIAGVKKRKQIPSSWFEKLSQKKISLDFIYFGKAERKSKASRDSSATGLDLFLKKTDESKKENSTVEFNDRKEDTLHAESLAVNHLLEYASLLRGKRLNNRNYSILKMILRKQIMGNLMEELIDLMNDLEKIADNHKDRDL